MKKTELQKLIKEEIRNILENEDPTNVGMKKAIGFQEPTGPRKTRIVSSLSNLPGYDNLPEARKDVDWSNRISIYLPSLMNPGEAMSEMLSKEEVNNWITEFKEKFKEYPNFEINGKEISLKNEKYKQVAKSYRKGKADWLKG